VKALKRFMPLRALLWRVIRSLGWKAGRAPCLVDNERAPFEQITDRYLGDHYTLALVTVIVDPGQWRAAAHGRVRHGGVYNELRKSSRLLKSSSKTATADSR
jgi:hypothetical protein